MSLFGIRSFRRTSPSDTCSNILSKYPYTINPFCLWLYSTSSYNREVLVRGVPLLSLGTSVVYYKSTSLTYNAPNNKIFMVVLTHKIKVKGIRLHMHTEIIETSFVHSTTSRRNVCLARASHFCEYSWTPTLLLSQHYTICTHPIWYTLMLLSRFK